MNAPIAVPSPLVRRLPVTAGVGMALFGVGFFFHTSFDPVILGKYNLRYLLLPALWYLVLTPTVYGLVRFLTRPGYVVLPRRGRVVVPWHVKLAWTLVLALFGYIGLEAVVSRVVARNTATFSVDVFHPFLQNTPRPNQPELHTNRFGFRGEEIEKQKPAGTYRIFVLGGSTVLCATVPYEQSHCRLLERRLQEDYPQRRIEVQNLGAEWHTSQHSVMKLLFCCQEFSPDLVICYHGINDLSRSCVPNAFSEGEYRDDYGHYYGPVATLGMPGKTQSFLLRGIAGHWCSDFFSQRVRIRGPEGQGLRGIQVMFFPKAEVVEIDHWPSLAAFDRNMRDLVQIARSKQIRVLLATQPSLYREDLTPQEREVILFPASQQFGGKQPSIGSMTRGMAQFNDAARNIARELNVPLVDLDRLMPKSLTYLYDDVHYTPAGNALIAEAFAKRIIESGWIEP